MGQSEFVDLERNLALETLRKLLTDQFKFSERTNLVQAQKLREALEKAMHGDTNKQITTAEKIAKLLELAKWAREAKQHGQDLPEHWKVHKKQAGD